MLLHFFFHLRLSTVIHSIEIWLLCFILCKFWDRMIIVNDTNRKMLPLTEVLQGNLSSCIYVETGVDVHTLHPLLLLWLVFSKDTSNCKDIQSLSHLVRPYHKFDRFLLWYYQSDLVWKDKHKEKPPRNQWFFVRDFTTAKKHRAAQSCPCTA